MLMMMQALPKVKGGENIHNVGVADLAAGANDHPLADIHYIFSDWGLVTAFWSISEAGITCQLYWCSMAMSF